MRRALVRVFGARCYAHDSRAFAIQIYIYTEALIRYFPVCGLFGVIIFEVSRASGFFSYVVIRCELRPQLGSSWGPRFYCIAFFLIFESVFV